nr:hypothetical protein [Tanacetum cinerariifolium]
MLLDSTIRKKVCPAFGSPIIRRMLDTFVPDEFCPDRSLEAVFKALDSEDSYEGEQYVTNLPWAVASVVYHPPFASSIRFIFGDGASQSQLTRSGSILKKSITSDDEIDELSSPLTSVIGTSCGSPAQTKPNWRSNDTCRHSSIRRWTQFPPLLPASPAVTVETRVLESVA